MINPLRVTWSALKSSASTRNIPMQYIETDTSYIVAILDSLFTLYTEITKRTPAGIEQNDFETNYKETLSINTHPVQYTALTLADDDLKMYAKAFNFTAHADSTTTYDYPLDDTYLLRGINFISDNALLGDYIQIQLVDKDNLLGLGANHLIKILVEKAWVTPTINGGLIFTKNIFTPQLSVAGLYLRVSYTNTSALSGVNLYVNLDLYKRC